MRTISMPRWSGDRAGSRVERRPEVDAQHVALAGCEAAQIPLGAGPRGARRWPLGGRQTEDKVDGLHHDPSNPQIGCPGSGKSSGTRPRPPPSCRRTCQSLREAAASLRWKSGNRPFGGRKELRLRAGLDCLLRARHEASIRLTGDVIERGCVPSRRGNDAGAPNVLRLSKETHRRAGAGGDVNVELRVVCDALGVDGAVRAQLRELESRLRTRALLGCDLLDLLVDDRDSLLELGGHKLICAAFFAASSCGAEGRRVRPDRR